ncbi:MAG: ribokinase [Microbacteriaceae bacterium]|nr:ribokinase [Microbacteriaceae bacterium]
MLAKIEGRMMSVVVVGSANLDLVYRVERIPGPGETVLATGYESNPGGKGNNQVVAVARAGASVTFVAALGRDSAADEIVASLDASGVTQLLRRVDAPTGTALITVDGSAENTIVVNSGANALLRDLDEGELAAIAQADLLLLQLETPLETVIEAAVVAREAGTTVVLNAAPIQSLPTELFDSVDLVIVNEHEAAQLARGVHPGIEIPETLHTADAAHIADVLTGLGVAVIITLGAEGALVSVPGEPAAHVPGIRVKAVDTTGAGDTFCGALIAALDARASHGADRRSRPELDTLVRAAEFATAAAALSVQRVGAVPSIPTLSEIKAFRSAR